MGIDKNDIPELTQVRSAKALFVFKLFIVGSVRFVDSTHEQSISAVCFFQQDTMSPNFFFPSCVDSEFSSLKIIIQLLTASRLCF